MKWGFFTLTHIVTLLLAALILAGLYFLLRNKKTKTQVAVLLPLSFLGIGAIIYELIARQAPLCNLPLHLCSFNAMVLPLAVLTRKKALCNLLLVWCLGALAALVLNNEMVGVELFSWTFFFYYFPHVMEFGIPILIFALKLSEKDPRCILSTLGISAGIYTVVHGLNLLINSYCAASSFSYNGTDIVNVNYMFSLRPNNPLTELFYSLIPHTYWYMYLVFPIVIVYLLIVYSPQLIAYFKKKKETVAK